MDFLENFLYYFVDNGIEIIEIVIVFITFFGMRADLTRKNLLLSFITLVLLSFLSVLEKQTYIFVILYILFFIMEIYILYNEFILRKLLFKGFWCLIFINIIDAMVYNSVKSIFGYCNVKNIVIIKLFTYIIVLVFLLIISKFIKNKVKFLL